MEMHSRAIQVLKNLPGEAPGPPYKRENPLSYSLPLAAYTVRYMPSAVDAPPPPPPPPVFIPSGSSPDYGDVYNTRTC